MKKTGPRPDPESLDVFAGIRGRIKCLSGFRACARRGRFNWIGMFRGADWGLWAAAVGVWTDPTPGNEQ